MIQSQLQLNRVRYVAEAILAILLALCLLDAFIGFTRIRALPPAEWFAVLMTGGTALLTLMLIWYQHQSWRVGLILLLERLAVVSVVLLVLSRRHHLDVAQAIIITLGISCLLLRLLIDQRF